MTKAPTCEEKGEETYTAVFTNPAFETQTQTVEIGALGHLYGEASYKWTKTDKGYTCTATRICQNDNTHVDKEAVAAAVEVAKAATCEEKGEETYTATLPILCISIALTLLPISFFSVSHNFAVHFSRKNGNS